MSSGTKRSAAARLALVLAVLSPAAMLGAAYLVGGLSAPAIAQTAIPGQSMVPLGYCQLASLSGATKLSSCSGGIPAGATQAYIEAEAQAVRYRDDGSAPSASVGMPIASGGALFYAGTLSAVQIIEQTASAKVNVLFYR